MVTCTLICIFTFPSDVCRLLLFFFPRILSVPKKKPYPLCSFRYPNPEAFSLDIRLVFDNCETFNEDDSDIGRAGHNMRKYFEKKWTEIFKVS